MSGQRSISVEIAGKLGQFALQTAFTAPPAGITALFGPSGCGKTTVLRCIAGLQRIPGRIEVNGVCWQDSSAGIFTPPHERHVGFVFQEASLFPHLSVRNNLLYGARRVRDAEANPASLDDIVALLGISHLLDRSPVTLSGGERQRVAVGRALLASPRVLLMDEPLSALDQATRDEILPYFERLHEQLALPVLYVSHDLAEVERLADTLVLMREGAVIAAGPIRQLQTDASLPLLSMPHATVVLKASVARVDDPFALTEFSIAGGRLIVPGKHGAIGDIRRLRISASDVSLSKSAPTDSTILNCLPARIVSIDAVEAQPQANIILALGDGGGGERIVARITRKSLANLGLAPGMNVFAQIKSVALVAAREGRSLRT